MKLQVGVKLLIKNSAGQYLLIQRSEPLPGETEIQWDIPGGRINSDERLEEALAREIFEEIGVKLNSPVELVKAQDIMRPEIDLHVVRLTYTTNFHHAITLSHEHQNYKWVTREDALDLHIDPYIREVLASP